jgi:hypothetical protein
MDFFRIITQQRTWLSVEEKTKKRYVWLPNERALYGKLHDVELKKEIVGRVTDPAFDRKFEPTVELVDVIKAKAANTRTQAIKAVGEQACFR